MSRKFCFLAATLAACSLAEALFYCGQTVLADDKAADTIAENTAAQLVEQLGSPSYRVRERATSELSKLGLSARTALLAGLQSDDAEIRQRCQRVLGAVLEQDYLARLAAFAADKEGKLDHQLPGWDRFNKLVGSGPETRSLFVEMLRAEPALMEASEAKPDRAAESLAARCQQVQESIYGNNFGDRKQPSLGTLTAMFFLAGDPAVAIADQTTNYLGTFSYQTAFQTSINSGPRSDLLRKLVAAWIVRTEGSNIAYQGLMLSLRYDLREGLTPALGVCKQAAGQPPVLQSAVQVVGKFGGKEHLAVLEPLLTNTAVCVTYSVNNEMFRTEVRDIALAVLVHLSGQDPKEYGFSRIEKNQMFLFNPSSLGFRESDSRPGLEKWKAWSAEQKKAPPG